MTTPSYQPVNGRIKNVRLDRLFIGLNSTSFELRISGLNSGIRNRHYFLTPAIFLFPKNGNESVNHADSGDIKFCIGFPGNRIL